MEPLGGGESATIGAVVGGDSMKPLRIAEDLQLENLRDLSPPSPGGSASPESS